MATYLERYLWGEYKQVWAELTALGPAIRDLPVYEDARNVALETMRRARANIETLAARLTGIGYRFGYPRNGDLTGCPPYTPPAEQTSALLAALNRVAGPIPLSL